MPLTYNGIGVRMQEPGGWRTVKLSVSSHRRALLCASRPRPSQTVLSKFIQYGLHTGFRVTGKLVFPEA